MIPQARGGGESEDGDDIIGILIDDADQLLADSSPNNVDGAAAEALTRDEIREHNRDLMTSRLKLLADTEKLLLKVLELPDTAASIAKKRQHLADHDLLLTKTLFNAIGAADAKMVAFLIEQAPLRMHSTRKGTRRCMRASSPSAMWKLATKTMRAYSAAWTRCCKRRRIR